MPTYVFRDKTTGEEWESLCSISKMEETIKDPNIELVIIPPKIIGGVGYTTELAQKKHPGWKERLQQIDNAKQAGTLKHWIK